MSADIYLFTGVRQERANPHRPQPKGQDECQSEHGASASPVFFKGEAVRVIDHNWERGVTSIPATVIGHKGEWVAVRYGDNGAASVHQANVQRAGDQPEVA